MTAAGLAAGLAAAALFLSSSIASLLFGVRPVDPATFAIVPLLLAARCREPPSGCRRAERHARRSHGGFAPGVAP